MSQPSEQVAAQTETFDNTFDLVSSTPIESLNLVCEHYQHKNTGAQHFHLAADNSENVFLVGLRTVPTDSTGVAHILEHTSLCGSEKYPVRDPFFMMIRRSLNTFMNAFTSSDWTAYPFASQSKKDFNNLLSVYLDAVFFARLDELDFAQEGCRIEFEETENSESDLVYKGVVFNEMKGAMSSIGSQLWQALGESLFPDTTYGNNSGGDPAAITDLTYEQLKAFYQTHYHPDNAVFFTYGDIPAHEHQVAFESQALSRFKNENINISVPHQAGFDQPIRTEKPYAFNEEQTQPSEEDLNKSHHVCAWVLDDILKPFDVMAIHLLSSVLLENSASPLQQALETSTLGSSPSPLCGVDDSGLQMIFVCGLEGCATNTQGAVEELILSTLKNVAENPPPHERLAALLDQLELQQREISGDSYPYGLQIILSGLATAMHRGNVANALNIDPVLVELRSEIAKPDFIRTLINRLLVDNPHRVTLSLQPDTELAQQEVRQEAEKLAKIKSELKEGDSQNIINISKALQDRQAQEDDPDSLPKVGIADVPEPAIPPAFRTIKRSATFYPQGTNGIAYHQLVSPLQNLDSEELTTLNLHNRLSTELGIGERSYLETQDWQSSICGGISAYHSLRSEISDEQKVSGYYTVSTKGLASRHSDLLELLVETRNSIRFDEAQRISELIAQNTARLLRSVTGQGHGLAMSCASQGMSPIARLSYQSNGMLGIARLKALDESLQLGLKNNSFEAHQQLRDQLEAVDQKLKASPFQILSVAEASDEATISAFVEDILSNSKTSTTNESTSTDNATALDLPTVREKTREFWVCNSQVNFCAKAYPTVPSGHEDAAALTVLAGVLRNGFLHTAIREQGGAYGGGASHDSATACFRFYSYRDPRMEETLDDFDSSIDWLLAKPLAKNAVEEAILGVISSIDKPASPAGTAKQHFHNLLFGRTPEILNEFRAQVLGVTENDLKRVAKDYLNPEQASIAVLSHAGETDNIQRLSKRLEMQVHQL